MTLHDQIYKLQHALLQGWGT